MAIKSSKSSKGIAKAKKGGSVKVKMTRTGNMAGRSASISAKRVTTPKSKAIRKKKR